MQFILSNGWEAGIADLTERLIKELSTNQPVLWLVSGGSNIGAAVTVMDSISEELSANLSVMLADERYGPVGHADSNWAQLLAAGFDGKQATLSPVLRDGDDLSQAAAYFAELVADNFSRHQVIIAQLGIGPDGHVSGILPNSPAAADTQELVVAYQGGDYQRLTTTFEALKHITIDYSFAYGEGKRAALTSLLNQDLPLAIQPSQILKQLPEAYVYNDQIGDTIEP